jgi:Nup53/35/40-type RNA recognition motif
MSFFRLQTILDTSSTLLNEATLVVPSTLGSWVLVFGYGTADQYDEFLRYFSSLGRVLAVRGAGAGGSPSQRDPKNWVCIQYASRLEAEKASCHDKVPILPGVYCGVRRVEDDDIILRQAMTEPSLSSLWSKSIRQATNQTTSQVAVTSSSYVGPGQLLLNNTGGLQESDIFLASPSSPKLALGREWNICERFARWVLSIED